MIQVNGLIHSIQVLLGGGRRNWLHRVSRDPENLSHAGRRLDGRDLIQDWLTDKKRKGKKAEYIWNREQLNKIDPEKVDYLLGNMINVIWKFMAYNFNIMKSEITITESIHFYAPKTK